LRRYETIFITLPELSEEELSEVREKINSILISYKGDLIKWEDWGVKKLTYEIRKNSRGRFFLMDYIAGKEMIRELERNLRLNDRVLRFQTIKIGAQISPEAIQTLTDAAKVEKTKPSERIESAAATKADDGPTPEGGEKE
jgi:small subunit ribosomal protein S6